MFPLAVEQNLAPITLTDVISFRVVSVGGPIGRDVNISGGDGGSDGGGGGGGGDGGGGGGGGGGGSDGGGGGGGG